VKPAEMRVFLCLEKIVPARATFDRPSDIFLSNNAGNRLALIDTFDFQSRYI
jgi:hypothetical protein